MAINKHTPTIQRYFSKDVIADTYYSWRKDRTLRLGAGLAYYGIFALVPVLALMGAIAFLFFDRSDVTATVVSFVDQVLGSASETARASVTNAILQAYDQISFGAVGFVSLASLVVTASFLFVAYHDALDTIWGKSIRTGLKEWAKRYVVAYGIVFLASSLLVGVLLINTVSSLAKYIVPGTDGLLDSMADIIVAVASIVLGAVIFATIMRILIHKPVPWRYLLIGSGLTTVLVILGTIGLSFYLSRFGATSLSGAVGAVALVLVWIYYEAQIILIGSQYTKTIYKRNSEHATSG